MRFIKTVDLVCNRQILLNVEDVGVTYLERISPKVTLIHYASGKTLKVSLGIDYLQNQFLGVGGGETLKQQTALSKAIDERRTGDERRTTDAGFSIGNEDSVDRRKTPDRRSTAPLEQPPKKSGKHEDDK